MMMQAGIQRGSSVHRISVQGSLVQGERARKGRHQRGRELGWGCERRDRRWQRNVAEGAQIKSCRMYFWLMPLQNWLKVVFWNFSVLRIPLFSQPKKSIGRRINIQILITVTKLDWLWNCQSEEQKGLCAAMAAHPVQNSALEENSQWICFTSGKLLPSNLLLFPLLHPAVLSPHRWHEKLSNTCSWQRKLLDSSASQCCSSVSWVLG